MKLETSVAEEVTAARQVASHSAMPAPSATDDLCNYDDGNPIAVYIDLHWGRIGWCAKHIGVAEWSARMFAEGWS